MASRPGIFSFDSWVSEETLAAGQHLAFGICEVISVGAFDELPYVFEINGGQKLSFSLTASHEVDLVLCDENAYDGWVDAGLQTEHPADAILTLRHACQHSLEFRPERGHDAYCDHHQPRGSSCAVRRGGERSGFARPAVLNLVNRHR